MTPGRIKSGDYPEDVAIHSLETWMSDHQVGVAIQEDKQYCHRLRTIKSAPYLYYRVGNHDLLYRPLLGIV
jgi:predicted Rossmann fold nucleotide-binding protein DprA/Smf involved in DNA uptake